MNTVHQLTIRGVDERTKHRLVTRAQRHGLSLNSYALGLLQSSVGTNTPARSNGLERFIGVAPFDSKVEAALRDQHQATPDKWDRLGL